MAFTHIVIMLLGGAEIVWLGAMHSRSLITWEPIWVIFISWLSYASDLIEPDSQWAKPVLINGEYVDWQKLAGWMATCPVLILFLVSLTTFGGRDASVRVVPLLVANQMMFLCGATSAFCTGPARWIFYGVSCSFGVYVFAASSKCFRSLYTYFGTEASGASGRKFVLGLATCFFVGWVIFPIVWTFGHSGLGSMSDFDCTIFQMLGDLLSKNTFVILAVILKCRWLTSDPRPLTALLMLPTQPSSWSELASALEANDPNDTTTDGAAAAHAPLARQEAARKLIGNHARVLADITRLDGPPASQPGLQRLPGKENDVDVALKEIARRLLGRKREQSRWSVAPNSPAQEEVWAATAKFLSARLQLSAAEVSSCATASHQRRKPDMSPAAGAAFRAVLVELAMQCGGQLLPSTWSELNGLLETSTPGETVADGAAAAHAPLARHEAARKLIGNHARVLADITRGDGPPPTQPGLQRLPGKENDVDVALKEVARRLVGQRLEHGPHRRVQPATPAQAEVWEAATAFLSARLQVSAAEVAGTPGHQHRKPDLSQAAGAAFRAVLAEVGDEQCEATTIDMAGEKQLSSPSVSPGAAAPQRIRRRPSIGNVALDDISVMREAPSPPPRRASGTAAGYMNMSATPIFGKLGAPAATPEARAMAGLLQEVANVLVAHANAPENAAHWGKALASAEREGASARLLEHSRKVKEYETEVALAMKKLTTARSELAAAAQSPGSKMIDVDVELAPSLLTSAANSSGDHSEYALVTPTQQAAVGSRVHDIPPSTSLELPKSHRAWAI